MHHIVESPGVPGGTACFRGTRLPIINARASVADGIPCATLHAAHPRNRPTVGRIRQAVAEVHHRGPFSDLRDGTVHKFAMAQEEAEGMYRWLFELYSRD